MKNIVLYLTYDGLTDPLGESQIIPYVQGLSEKGYAFHVISCEKPERYLKHKDRITAKLLDYGIVWHPLVFYSKPPIFSTVLNLYRVYQKATSLRQDHHITLVHCRSYLVSLLGLKLKQKYQIPFLFDMRGFWIEERIEGGLWNMNNPLYRIIHRYFKKKEEAFFLTCDACVCLTEKGKEEITNRFKENKQTIPVSVIPCSVSFEKFSIPDEHQIARTKKELMIPENSFVLSYSGSIGTWYMLDEMMSFYRCLLNTFPEAYFLILTSDEPLLVEEKARQMNIDVKKVIIRFLTREQMPGVISISDLSVFFIRPTFSKLASSPTKLGELLALGIPVVCNKGIGDVDSIIERMGGGVVLNEFSNQEYQKAIEEVSHKKYDKSTIRSRSESYYELRHAVNTYYLIYQNCIR